MTESSEPTGNDLPAPQKTNSPDCWAYIIGALLNNNSNQESSDKIDGDGNYGAKPAMIYYDSDAKPKDNNADDEALDILLQNPGINGATLLNTLKAKGLKIVDATPDTGMEADSASTMSQITRAGVKEELTFAPGKSVVKAYEANYFTRILEGGPGSGRHKGGGKKENPKSIKPSGKDHTDSQMTVQEWKDKNFPNKQAFISALDDLEKDRSAFWSRNSDGTVSINFRSAHGNDPTGWINARAASEKFGIYSRGITPDRMSGHIVLKVQDPFHNAVTKESKNEKVKESNKLKETSNLQFRSCRFVESASTDDGVGPTKFKTILLQEGLGNLRDTYYYTRSALETAVPVFEGKKIYADHPSSFDDETRPERSVKDVLGHFQDIHIEEDGDGRAQLVGDVVILPDKPYEWARGLMRHSVAYSQQYPDKDFVGLSINASGDAQEVNLSDYMKENQIPKSIALKLQKAQEEGVETIRLVNTINNAVSCDLVTEAGAGGKILEMLEREREMAKKKLKEAGDDGDAKKTIGPAESEKKEMKKEDAPPAPAAKDDGDDDGGDAGHDDASQDKELIHKMLKKHGLVKDHDPEGAEAMYQAYGKGYQAAMEAGMEDKEASDHVVKAMKMADIMKAFEARQGTQTESEGKEGEAKEACKEDETKEAEGKVDDVCTKEAEEKEEEKKESAKSEVMTLRGRLAKAEAKIRSLESEKHLESVLRKSGLPNSATKLFREGLGEAKSVEEIDREYKKFVEAYKLGGGEATGFVISTEKLGETKADGSITFSDCKLY